MRQRLQVVVVGSVVCFRVDFRSFLWPQSVERLALLSLNEKDEDFHLSFVEGDFTPEQFACNALVDR